MIEDKLNALGAIAKSPLTDGEIWQIEAKIGCSLPSAYRQMLVAFGGVSFNDVFYWDMKQQTPVQFGWFFDYDELLNDIDSYCESIPNTMIAIGDDGGGNLYCLGVKGKDRDKVYFHDHNIGWSTDDMNLIESGNEVPDHIRLQTVCKLSDSFEEFIDAMFYDG